MTQTRPTPKADEKIAAAPQVESDPAIYFQYQGTKGLTVVGPVSQKRYRFAGPGQVIAVDPVDKRALAGVSVLRQVRMVAGLPKEL